MRATANPLLPDNVRNALRDGNTVDAIKLLRESTGVGLKDAKDLIDKHLRASVTHSVADAPVSQLPAAVINALRRGKKIEAIGLLRERTGLGLKDAKEAVEAFSDQADAAVNELSPGEVAKTGKLTWIAVALVSAAFAAYYFLRGAG